MRASLLPSSALPLASATTLTEAQVASWREQGFALVDGVFPEEAVLRPLVEAALAAFPAPGTPAARAFTDFGGGLTFPSPSAPLNDLVLHPRLLAAVAQLLGVPVWDVRLTQAEVWPKYGREEGSSGGELDNSDQRMHCDYPNHTLVHPPPWGAPEAVELIVYLSDEAACGGATAVVPRQGPDDPAYAYPIVHTPGVGALEWVNDRLSAEAYLARAAPAAAAFRAEHLYPRERAAAYAVGTTLFYRHDTWHRGTPVRPGALRTAANLTFRRSASEWVSTLHAGWAWAMYRAGLPTERLIAGLSVQQRAVLGFPRPGSPYWTPETVLAVAARYTCFGLDITPYAAALAEAPST